MKKLIHNLNYLAAYAVAATATNPGLAGQPGVDITIQSLFGIIAGLACWGTRFVTVIMVVVIIWYGTQMMTARGDQTKFTGARKSLSYAVVGMLVILGAYTIIATVANTIEGVGQQDLSYKAAKYSMFVPLSCAGY